MIPIAANIPNRSQPIVTYLLVGFSIALFVWELKLEVTGELSNTMQTWGLVPSQLTNVAKDAMAQRNPAAWFVLIVMSARSLLSQMFLHGSFSQILGNLLFLWVFGQKVEDILGHGRFLLFYLICGVLAGAMQILAEPTLEVPLVGANGAIAGILGAYLSSFPKAKVESILPLAIVFIPIELPVLFYLAWWFIQQIFYGIGQLAVAGGVNSAGLGYWAHGAGLAIGIALVVVMVQRKPSTAIY